MFYRETPASGHRGVKRAQHRGGTRTGKASRPFFPSATRLAVPGAQGGDSQGSTKPRYPRSLTIVWGCYQGGVETAVRYRLLELNRLGAPAHAYFYHEGAGINNFQNIPNQISHRSGDLIDYVHRHNFDVITFVNTMYNLETIANSGFQGTCIFEMHGFAPAILEELNRINQHKDGGQIKAVVVPGQHVAAMASAALWNRPDIELHVARNPLDTELFHRKPTHLSQMVTFLPSEWVGSPLLGWVGRIEPNKNWRLLLQVFARVKNRHPSTRLLIACDKPNSPEMSEFVETVKDYRLNEDVLILENVSYQQMPDYYSLIAESGGVLLSTSYSEGYPYHLLEAQACTCPVVCSLAGGNPEVVAHGSTGFVFSAQNPDDAVTYVHKLLTNPNLSKQIGIEERKKVCTQNRIQENIERYLHWLSQVANFNPGRI